MQYSYNLIGIAGAAGSGKDTAAAYLADNYDMRHDAFAKPIKAAVAAMFDLDPALLEDRVHKEHPAPGCPAHWPSLRWIMQNLGTEFAREQIDPNIWLELAKQRHYRHCYDRPTVISDVRFPNEAQWILSAGGILIYLQRPGEAIAESQHASENQGIEDLATVIIRNDEGLDALYWQLDEVLVEGPK